jgi:hypothetical protein
MKQLDFKIFDFKKFKEFLYNMNFMKIFIIKF